MQTSTTARDYAVGTVLVIVAFAVAFLIARYFMPADVAEVRVQPRLGMHSDPAPQVGAGTAVLVSRQTHAQDPWLATDTTQRKAQLMGRFDPSRDSAFVVLAKAYTDGEQDYYLRRQTARAVMAMIDSARADGIKLEVRSATRNFDRQAQIWGAKWRGDRTLSNGVNLAQRPDLSDSAKARMILLYSSMPGTSRHHWGTDVDFNAFENAYFSSGQGLAEYTWLLRHAAHFGFVQPYTSKAAGRTGYEEEKWHWSYLPLSQNLLAAYAGLITTADIAGFEGAEVAGQVNAIEEYVRGVNEEPFTN